MILAIVIFIILNTAGLLLLKTSLPAGFSLSSQTIISLFYNLRFIFGFIFYASSFLTWLYLLSKKDIVYIYPIAVGLSYVAIIIASMIFLKETLTLPKTIGIVLIGLGLVFIAR